MRILSRNGVPVDAPDGTEGNGETAGTGHAESQRRRGGYRLARDGIGLRIRLEIGIRRIGIDGGLIRHPFRKEGQRNRHFAGVFIGDAAHIPDIVLAAIRVHELPDAGFAGEPAGIELV